MKKTKYFIIAALLMMGSLVTTSQTIAQQPPSDAPTPVIVANVIKTTFSDNVEALGTLKANESVDISSTVTELVTEINFKDGQRVNKGDVLIRMDAAEELAELSEEQSVIEEAQRQVNRLEPLVKDGAASASALDEQKRDLLSAQARIQAIQSRIDKRIIKAPFDGIVGLRNVSVGALAQPGSMLTSIDDDSIMKLDFSVPAVFISTLKPGVMIESTTKAYPEKIFKGEIASVDSRIDPVTRSIEARALVDNQEGLLKPGLLMQIELSKSPRETLVIPEEALIPEGSKNFVLVVTKQEGMITATRREVKLGTRQYGEAEIIQGLSEGEQVVTHGTLRVRPGTPINITAVEDEDQTLRELMQQKDKKAMSGA